jgi:hypothetical protein
MPPEWKPITKIIHYYYKTGSGKTMVNTWRL